MTRPASKATAALTALVLAAIPGLACSDDDDPAAGKGPAQPAPFERTVTVAESGYKPKLARVLVGGSITWVNRDKSSPHTAETQSRDTPERPWDEEQDFDTHTLTWGEPYTVTFHKPGAFEYHCSFHSDMKGTVVVLARRF